MTAIVFHQGKIYGDRKQVSFTTPVTFIDGEKVLISKDKSFAYAVSGKSVTELNRDKYESLFRALITAMYLNGRDCIKLTDLNLSHGNDIDFTNAIICTKNVQYALKDTGIVFVVRLDGKTHACGTGGPMLASLLRCGLTPNEAFKRLPTLDYLSGSTFDTIDTTRLKQFVIKGGE
jgi:hypothetical protein